MSESAPIEIVGCDLWNPSPVDPPASPSGNVTIGPGGYIFVRGSRDEDGIRLRQGAWIRALEGGGFVIETAGDVPGAPAD